MKNRDRYGDSRQPNAKNSKTYNEQATHFGDAVDKRMWTKYGHLINLGLSTFVSPRW